MPPTKALPRPESAEIKQRAMQLRGAGLHDSGCASCDPCDCSLPVRMNAADLLESIAAERDAALQRADAWKLAFEIAEAIPNMTDAQLEQLKANCRAAKGIVDSTPKSVFERIRAYFGKPPMTHKARSTTTARECRVYKGHYPAGRCPATECIYPVCLQKGSDE